MEKLFKLIDECKLAVHDISRTELDSNNNLPRFNMPFELGLFLGARRFVPAATELKSCLIFEREQYSYQKYLSDIAGQDIRSHNGNVETLIKQLRNWLSNQSRPVMSGTKPIPAAKILISQYQTFTKTLPEMCRALQLDSHDLPYNDYATVVAEWLRLNPPSQFD
jgi:hypothetical protein